MAQKLFVGGIAFSTTDEGLGEFFGQAGTVVSARVVTDQFSGRSRGFGFVEMSDGADEAIRALNGTDLQGRNITVNEARPREERRDRGPRGGGGGGGYGRRY